MNTTIIAQNEHEFEFHGILNDCDAKGQNSRLKKMKFAMKWIDARSIDPGENRGELGHYRSNL